jgi:protein involved in polysaccharide export with SLBB domain
VSPVTGAAAESVNFKIGKQLRQAGGTEPVLLEVFRPGIAPITRAEESSHMAKLAGSLLVAGLLLLPGSARAQADSSGIDREMATRAELQASLNSAEGDTRAAIQQRLSEGDFQPGDLIALTVIEESTLTDTFTVRSGRTLQLPNLPEISLKGVLRSELRSFLTGKVAEHIRNPQVDAVALIRVAVLGAVNRPGFYNVPAETPAAEVVMIAGGPSQNTDLKKVEVRRGETVVIPRDAMTTAFAAGTSIDQLNVHGGDQIVIGQKSGGWRGTIQTVGLFTGLLSGIYFATRIF